MSLVSVEFTQQNRKWKKSTNNINTGQSDSPKTSFNAQNKISPYRAICYLILIPTCFWLLSANEQDKDLKVNMYVWSQTERMLEVFWWLLSQITTPLCFPVDCWQSCSSLPSWNHEMVSVGHKVDEQERGEKFKGNLWNGPKRRQKRFIHCFSICKFPSLDNSHTEHLSHSWRWEN